MSIAAELSNAWYWVRMKKVRSVELKIVLAMRRSCIVKVGAE